MGTVCASLFSFSFFTAKSTPRRNGDGDDDDDDDNYYLPFLSTASPLNENHRVRILRYAYVNVTAPKPLLPGFVIVAIVNVDDRVQDGRLLVANGSSKSNSTRAVPCGDGSPKRSSTRAADARIIIKQKINAETGPQVFLPCDWLGTFYWPNSFVYS